MRINTKTDTTRVLKTVRGHLMPRSSICIMDLPALWTIPFLHGNRLGPMGESMLEQEWTCTLGQHGWPTPSAAPCGRADVGTGQTSGRTTGQRDGEGEMLPLQAILCIAYSGGINI